MKKHLKVSLEKCFDMIERVEVITDIKKIIEQNRRNNNVTCFLIQMFTFVVVAILSGYLCFQFGKKQMSSKLTYPEYKCRYNQYIEWRYSDGFKRY